MLLWGRPLRSISGTEWPQCCGCRAENWPLQMARREHLEASLPFGHRRRRIELSAIMLWERCLNSEVQNTWLLSFPSLLKFGHQPPECYGRQRVVSFISEYLTCALGLLSCHRSTPDRCLEKSTQIEAISQEVWQSLNCMEMLLFVWLNLPQGLGVHLSKTSSSSEYQILSRLQICLTSTHQQYLFVRCPTLKYLPAALLWSMQPIPCITWVCPVPAIAIPWYVSF